MSQLTRKRVLFSGSAAGLRALRAQFQSDHYIILPNLIKPDLPATILKRIESAPSVHKEDDGVVAESIIDDSLTYNLFLSLVNAPEFWDWKGSSYPPSGTKVYESKVGEGVGFVFGCGARGPVEGGGAGPRAPDKIGACPPPPYFDLDREMRDAYNHRL